MYVCVEVILYVRMSECLNVGVLVYTYLCIRVYTYVL